MNLKIRDILRNKSDRLLTIAPDRTLRAAIEDLTEHRIGALLVMRDRGKSLAGELVGIISERDIMRQCAMRADLDKTLVSDAMTRYLIVGLEDDDLAYTMNTMTEARVRHLPIMRRGELMGIVSIGDVVNALRVENSTQVRYLTDYIQGRYF